GWTGSETPSVSSHLAEQFRGRFRALPIWPRLLTHFQVLDMLPIVRLHGDVKPEHLLVDAVDTVTVVDWEAIYRGPAVLDEADIVFRILREVVYANLTLTAENLALLPWTHTHMAALGWRIALWLDRRHRTLTDPIASLVERITQLPNEAQPLDALVSIMRMARMEGTGY
ncbi:MAG: phosphotransferase, partial [Candidatus Dormibacteraceae bacterium]